MGHSPPRTHPADFLFSKNTKSEIIIFPRIKMLSDTGKNIRPVFRMDSLQKALKIIGIIGDTKHSTGVGRHIEPARWQVPEPRTIIRLAFRKLKRRAGKTAGQGVHRLSHRDARFMGALRSGNRLYRRRDRTSGRVRRRRASFQVIPFELFGHIHTNRSL